MFKIDSKTKQIDITRGDAAIFEIQALNIDGSNYTFKVNDVIRFKVFKRRDCGCVEIKKEVTVMVETTKVEIELTKDDTKIGDIINKPVNYWYEVELNPETFPQTIIGYDSDGEKIFRLYPEGVSLND